MSSFISAPRGILESRNFVASPAPQSKSTSFFHADNENFNIGSSPGPAGGAKNNPGGFRDEMVKKVIGGEPRSASKGSKKPLSARGKEKRLSTPGGNSQAIPQPASKIPAFSPSRMVNSAKKTLKTQVFNEENLAHMPANENIPVISSGNVNKISNNPNGQDDCTSCTKLRSAMINAQEDIKEYQQQYSRIQQEGTRLYEVYEIKVKKLAESKERITELDARVDNMNKESEMLKEQYNEIFDAYNDLVERYKASKSELRDKSEEVEGLNGRILKLINSQLTVQTAGPTDLQISEQARALAKQAEHFKNEVTQLHQQLKQQEEFFNKQLQEAENSFENKLKEAELKIEQLLSAANVGKARLDALTQNKQELTQELRKKESFNVQLQQQNAEMTKRNNELQLEIEKMSSKEEAFKVELAGLENQVNNASSLQMEKAELEEFFAEERTANASILEDVQNKLSASLKQVEDAEALNDTYRHQAEEHTKRLEQSQKAHQQTTEKCEQLGEQLSKNSERLNELSAELMTERLVKAAAQRELAEFEAQNLGLKETSAKQTRTIEFITNSLKEVEASLAEATNEMLDREAEWEKIAAQQREDAKNKIEKIASDAANKEKETSRRLCKALSDLEAALQKANEGNKENMLLKRNIQELKTSISSSESEIQHSASELKEAQAALQEAKIQNVALHEEIVATKRKFMELENATAAAERHFSQTRQALKNKTQDFEQMSETANNWREKAAKAEGRNDALAIDVSNSKKQLLVQRDQVSKLSEELNFSLAKIQEMKQLLVDEATKVKDAKDKEMAAHKDKERIQEQMDQLLYHWDQKDISQDKAVHLVLKEKFELEKKLREAKATEQTSSSAQKQLRHYLLLYKQKADEKQKLTETTMSQQEDLIKTLDSRLRRIALVGSRFSHVIESEPELASAFESLTSHLREVDEQGTSD